MGLQGCGPMRASAPTTSEEGYCIPFPPGRRKLHIRSLLLPFQTVTALLGCLVVTTKGLAPGCRGVWNVEDRFGELWIGRGASGLVRPSFFSWKIEPILFFLKEKEKNGFKNVGR